MWSFLVPWENKEVLFRYFSLQLGLLLLLHLMIWSKFRFGNSIQDTRLPKGKPESTSPSFFWRQVSSKFTQDFFRKILENQRKNLFIVIWLILQISWVRFRRWCKCIKWITWRRISQVWRRWHPWLSPMIKRRRWMRKVLLMILRSTFKLMIWHVRTSWMTLILNKYR